MTHSGWILDAYPLKDRMVVWLKTKGGGTVRLEDSWTCSIYVAADNRADLSALARNNAVQHYAKNHTFEQKYERITERQKSTVLKLTLRESSKAAALAGAIEDIDVQDKFRLYNVDVLPQQSYFYEHGIFPLAKCRVDDKLDWQVDDDVRLTDYELPTFKLMFLDVSLKQEGRLPKFSDRIDKIRLKTGGETTVVIEMESEEQALTELVEEVAKIDPDFVFTIDGDEFVLPYLAERAAQNGMKLTLSREKDRSISKPSNKGVTYFSYGRVHYRPSSVMLYGRIHIDRRNWVQLAWSDSESVVDDSEIQGLFEMARICRMPLHTTSRVTIGRCLSSMQIFLAHKRGILVPWHPETLEQDKSYRQLLVADRGGFILEPVVGVHEKVAEFDFVGLFPNIMRKLNIAGETINCECCPDSKNIVPEVGFRICEKKRGLVSEALEVPLDNRAAYKRLKKMATDDKSCAVYESRQSILRSIGHVSFGYLGHANSKFGLIDAHIAVCANARAIAKTARKVAESLSYDVLHVIIDSIFAKKGGATYQDYMKLKQEIESKTNFDINYEGEYKWVAFLPSKGDGQSPVPNRYFGVYQDGKIKDRGIETRRHDTPPLFSKFQKEVLKIMASGNTVKEVKELMPLVFDTFEKYKERLQSKQVQLADLIFTKMLSKDSSGYSVNTVENSALFQLHGEGESMRAGQTLQYVITDYYRKYASKRSVPVELINEKTTYDAKRYVELLAVVCNSVIEPFGCSVTPIQNNSNDSAFWS